MIHKAIDAPPDNQHIEASKDDKYQKATRGQALNNAEA
jgi:hypothetical protein